MDGGSFFQILLMLAFGGIVAAIANSKGRSTIGWFCLGFFFPCLGLIIILCLSNLKEEQARFSAQQNQNRRLQEQLRQEQMKSESLRNHTMARLDQHDEVLGIDTTQTAPALALGGNATPAPQFANIPAAPAKPPEPPKPVGSNPPESSPAIWFYEENGEQKGPASVEELKTIKRFGNLTGETLVWREGMTDWEPAKYKAELSNIFLS